MAAQRKPSRRAGGTVEIAGSKSHIDRATQAFFDREIARLRRTVNVSTFASLSDTDLTALSSGIEEHQRVVELVEQHIEERRRAEHPPEKGA